MQRATCILRNAKAVVRSQSIRKGGDYGHGHLKSFKELDQIYKTSMDFLPKPSGSWQEGYRAKDQKATIFFASSVAFFCLTIAEMRRQGCFDLLTDPANWDEKQVARQAAYYAKGNKWRKQPDEE